MAIHRPDELWIERLREVCAHTVGAPGLLGRQLDAVLSSGVAYEREESTVGLLCVAAPVMEADGRTARAAISVTGPVGRFRPEIHVDAVRAAATGAASVLTRRRAVR